MWQHKGNMTKLLQNINSENKGGHPLKKLIKKYLLLLKMKSQSLIGNKLINNNINFAKK